MAASQGQQDGGRCGRLGSKQTRNGRSFCRVFLKISIKPTPPALVLKSQCFRVPEETTRKHCCDSLFISQEKKNSRNNCLTASWLTKPLRCFEGNECAGWRRALPVGTVPKAFRGRWKSGQWCKPSSRYFACSKETLRGKTKNATDLQNSGMSKEDLTMAGHGWRW